MLQTVLKVLTFKNNIFTATLWSDSAQILYASLFTLFALYTLNGFENFGAKLYFGFRKNSKNVSVYTKMVMFNKVIA